MTSASDILDSLISAVASIQDFSVLMTNADGTANIYAYHDVFPAETNINRALNELTPPGCMIAWMGTAAGEVERNEMWRHRFRAHVRLGAEISSTYPDVLKTMLDGIPVGSTVKLIQSFIHPNCLPMELPNSARRFGTNGLEYMAVDIVLAEIGDN